MTNNEILAVRDKKKIYNKTQKQNRKKNQTKINTHQFANGTIELNRKNTP